MSQRLSESAVIATLDTGHKGIPWQPGAPVGFLAGVDLIS